MIVIEKISKRIEGLIKEAECDAKSALEFKKDQPALAEAYYKMATERMADILSLHTIVASMIDTYRKENGEPPQSMLILYNILHKAHIEDMAAVKGILALYKEI